MCSYLSFTNWANFQNFQNDWRFRFFWCRSVCRYGLPLPFSFGTTLLRKRPKFKSHLKSVLYTVKFSEGLEDILTAEMEISNNKKRWQEIVSGFRPPLIQGYTNSSSCQLYINLLTMCCIWSSICSGRAANNSRWISFHPVAVPWSYSQLPPQFYEIVQTDWEPYRSLESKYLCWRLFLHCVCKESVRRGWTLGVYWSSFGIRHHFTW